MTSYLDKFTASLPWAILATALLGTGTACAPSVLAGVEGEGYRSRTDGPSVRFLDGGDVYVPPSTPDAGGGGTKIPDGTDAGGTIPDAGVAIPDAAPTVSAYPAGPYGDRVNAVLEDHSFELAGAGNVAFSEVRAEPGAKVILYVISAEWCPSCQQQTSHLQDLHQEFNASGLRIVETLTQDSSYGPADRSTADRWHRQFGGDYKVAGDPDPAIQVSVLPTTFVVDAETMRILETYEGDDSSMDRRIEQALGESTR